MSARRRSKSREKKIPSKLRMDSKPPTPRITDPRLPAGRRKEIDNVMKKARAQTSPLSGAFWDKKLLEVEAKDPNRWRHSGYKSLYIDGGSRSRSRSRSGTRSRTRSPRPPPSPRRRSPPPRFTRVRSPRSPPLPPPRSRSGSPMRARRSPRSPPPPLRRPRSPPSPAAAPPKKRSASNSSISSCSDESCSVCSPKNKRAIVRNSAVRVPGKRHRSRSMSPPMQYRLPVPRKPPPPNTIPKIMSPPKRPRARPPSPTSPPPQPRRMPTTPPPLRKGAPKSDRPTDPRRQPPPPRPRGSSGEVIDLRGVKPPPKLLPPKKGDKVGVQPMLLKRIKKERAGKRPGSPGIRESSGSDESRASSPAPAPIVATTSLTLSERFGKIAQWSADRERRDLENMRITKTGGSMKVMVEEELLYGSPPRSLSPVPSGHFPDKLLSSGQSRLASWDDVRVRYQYYKDLGYLRDLSLDDYVKWEEWWYKYQDWLANERHYERWLASHGSGRRRGKKRPASQRLN